jgi:hypothetical protein
MEAVWYKNHKNPRDRKFHTRAPPDLKAMISIRLQYKITNTTPKHEKCIIFPIAPTSVNNVQCTLSNVQHTYSVDNSVKFFVLVPQFVRCTDSLELF